jgi:asparagine synthetase B (glutamine-hydrolysing)
MFTTQTKKLFFVANLTNENLDNTGFYVINEDESKIKSNIYSAALEHRKAGEEGCSFLPGGVDEPIVIILLKKPLKDPVVDAIWNFLSFPKSKSAQPNDLNNWEEGNSNRRRCQLI